MEQERQAKLETLQLEELRAEKLQAREEMRAKMAMVRAKRIMESDPIYRAIRKGESIVHCVALRVRPKCH